MAGRRSTLPTLLAGVALAVGVVAAPSPAAADPVQPLSTSLDKYAVVPGESATLTVTFTNTEETEITFSYLSIIPSVSTLDNLEFAITSCTGEITWCSVWGDDHGASVHHAVVIPPGATRTVNVAFEVAADTPCVGNPYVRFEFYSYSETATGSAELNTMYLSPGTGVNCYA